MKHHTLSEFVMMGLASIAAALAGCSAPAGPRIEWSDEHAKAASLWSTERLDLDIHIRPAQRQIHYKGSMKLRLNGDESPGPTLSMNSRKAIFGFERVDGPAGSSVILNSTHAKFPFARMASITLPERAVRDEHVTVEFECRNYGDSFQVVTRPDIALASWTEVWYPITPPDEQDGISARMAAAGRTRFHLPHGWDVVSNGRRLDRRETAEGVIVEWELDQPAARSFAAAPYHSERYRVGSREVGVYLLSASPESAKEQAEILGHALQAMEDRLGPYPYPSYAIAEVPRWAVNWYASSEQGFIMARSDAFEHGPNLPLFAHEMAHGWWGNLVNTSGPGSIMCSEGLAQYCAVIAIEALEGQKEATTFLRFSRRGYNQMQCAYGYFKMLRRGQDAPLSKLTDEPFAHDLADAKGHWVYHMLRGRIGDDLFFGVLRGLIRDFAGKTMTLKDVRKAFIAESPAEAELERYFEDWLDRSGVPVIDVEWTPITLSTTGDESAVDLVLKQAQRGEPYSLTIEVAVIGENGNQLHTIKMKDREFRTRLPSRGKPSEIRIDPYHRLLIWHEHYGARP